MREDVTLAQEKAYTEALNKLDERMAEVRRLEIPVLLFMRKVHREAVLTYTCHLADRLVAGVTMDPVSFSDVTKEGETLGVMMLEAVRADFKIR